MVFNATTIGNEKEILKKKCGGEYFENITLGANAFTNGVCKAGNPISAQGVVANTSSAVGILLNDTYSDNPNATIVKAFAVVNETAANANASITLSSDAKSALANIIFA